MHEPHLMSCCSVTMVYGVLAQCLIVLYFIYRGNSRFRNFDFVFGGGSVGLMGEAARSAQKFGSKVHGVIPKFLTKNEIPLRRINLTITVKLIKLNHLC